MLTISTVLLDNMYLIKSKVHMHIILNVNMKSHMLVNMCFCKFLDKPMYATIVLREMRKISTKENNH